MRRVSYASCSKVYARATTFNHFIINETTIAMLNSCESTVFSGPAERNSLRFSLANRWKIANISQRTRALPVLEGAGTLFNNTLIPRRGTPPCGYC